jgi:hypothetical protein
VDVDIDSTGAVKETHLIRTPALLQDEPLRAARLWRFEPAPEVPIRTVRLTFVYDLVRDPRGDEELYSAFVPPYRVDLRAKCQRHCDQLEKVRQGAFMGLP